MPVSSGTIITAGFFNAIQTTTANVLGPSGYGAPVTSAQVSSGSIVTAAAWNTLRNDINTCRTIQSGSPFTNTQLPAVSVGQIIYASDVNLYETAANTITANYAGNSVLVNGSFSDARTTTWNGTIDNEVLIDFGSVAAANTFFTNSGDIRLALSQTVNSTVQDSLWVYNLSNLGTVIFGNTTTTRSGTTGTPSAIGWNTLTTVYQPIVSAFHMTGGSSYTSYAVDNLYIYAKKNASGTGVILKVELTNGDAIGISSGATATYGFKKRIIDTSPSFAIQGSNNLDT
jgi:hypothetical protein